MLETTGLVSRIPTVC